jgi:FMN reductase
MTTETDTQPFSVVVVTAGIGEPSSTRRLADQIARHVSDLAGGRGERVTLRVVDLRPLATEIMTAMVSQLIGPELQRAIDALAAADGVIAATPVYKAGASGLFTSFFQVLDDDLLIAKPVVLAATAGTARHALVVDDQVRPLFAYLRALPVPTALFAAPEDWGDPGLTSRVERAALELVLLMAGGFARQVRDQSWTRYHHEFGSAGATDLPIDLDSALMRLATGGPAT